MMVAYGLPALPAPAAMEEIAEPWRPYRTLACRYLWRALDNEPV
jgi:DNA-3-methyladenine glycosylase II